MKNILIAGGSGLIGNSLVREFKAQGHKISLLSFSGGNVADMDSFAWDPAKRIIPIEVLHKAQYIINLSGAGIADRLWTQKRKKLILNSRTGSTRLLVDTLLKQNIKPELFINASAIGYYGDRPGISLHEDSSPGKGLLSEVCREWEKPLNRLNDAGIPCAVLRTGIVLSNQGGSFPRLIMPLRYGLNILPAGGRKSFPWIHIDDVAGVILALLDGSLKPMVYNLVAPESTTLREFNKVALNIMKKRAVAISLPPWVMKLLLGELSALFLDEMKVEPFRLKNQGFPFKFPDAASAIKSLLP